MKILNKDYIELHYSSSNQIDEEKKVGGIIIPTTVGNGITKTVICTVKDINEFTECEYNIHKGDEILVDRYAIIQTSKGLDEYASFVKINSVIMVKCVHQD